MTEQENNISGKTFLNYRRVSQYETSETGVVLLYGESLMQNHLASYQYAYFSSDGRGHILPNVPPPIRLYLAWLYPPYTAIYVHLIT